MSSNLSADSVRAIEADETRMARIRALSAQGLDDQAIADLVFVSARVVASVLRRPAPEKSQEMSAANWVVGLGLLLLPVVGGVWGCNAYKAHRVQALTGVQVTAMDVFLGVDQKVRVIREVAP